MPAPDEAPDVPAIASERLCLVWLSPAFLEASLAGRTGDAEALIDAVLPDGWPTTHASRVMRRRVRQIADSPEDAPWLLRAIVRSSDRRVVGYINFHGRPDEYGRAELGYAVVENERRQGYATEAVQAMIRWARHEHAVRRFRLSISPDNAPSLGLAAKLGFVRTGEQMDEEDGLEYVFDLTVP